MDAADRALSAGYYIAGFLSYESGASCSGLNTHNDGAPLLKLGLYERAKVIELGAPEHPAAITPPVPRIQRAAYDAMVERIRGAIVDGEVYQVNYTVPLDLHYSGDAFDLYRLLARSAGAEYCAYVEDGNFALLSFSPELFLRFEPGRIATKPMKGTAKLDETADLTNEKNRAEHLMIVDLLRNDLHRVCNDVTVENLFTVERYPTFATMTSTISGSPKAGVSLRQIFEAAFPCGSVTGAPKRAAMAQIAALEPQPRGVYTGSIGYLSPQRTGWWNVAIRTMQADTANGTARLDAGGGIVCDSVADDEWNELLLKTAFLQPALQSFAVLETLRCGPDASDAAAHLDRLSETARRFNISFDRRHLQEQLQALNTAPAQLLVRIRLEANGTAQIESAPLNTPDRVTLCVSDERVNSSDPMLRYKTTWRAAHDRAAAQARAAGCFDALLRNEREELTEGSRTNLFVQLQGKLYTPPLSSGLLPGVLRQELIAKGRCAERVLFERDLHEAEAIFAGNSARGLIEARMTKEPHRVG